MDSKTSRPGEAPAPAAVSGRLNPLDPLLSELTAQELELVSAASSLVPVLDANAETADATRRLPEEDLKVMREAGLFRLATPRAYGGYEASACAVTAAAAELGRGCSAASWVQVVYYSGSQAVSMFPGTVQDRVWGQDPDVTVCGATAGGVTARAVDGGYLLSGRSGWASGVHHASWAVVGVTDEPGDAAQSPESAKGSPLGRGLALVPVSELAVEDTWHMAGMRGTGSDTIVADNVFVPREQVLFPAAPGGAARRGQATQAEARVTRPRPQGLGTGLLAATMLGMGMAVYDHIVGKLTEGRPLVSAASLHARAVDAPGVQANVADAAMLIDSAVLQIARSARAVDASFRTGEPMSALATARIRMDAGLAARRVREAVDKLLDAGGASRFAETSPVQRIWRDLGTATRHPAAVIEIDRERYARMLLGLSR